MSYVLDTNVVSALMRGESVVEDRLLSQNPSTVYLTQPVVAEVNYGLARLPRSRRRTHLSMRFELLTGVLPRAEWSDEVSASFGVIKAQLEKRGQRLDDFDIAIAAHALALGATLATRNVQHFSRVTDLSIEVW